MSDQDHSTAVATAEPPPEVALSLLGGGDPGATLKAAIAQADALKPLTERRSGLTGRPMVAEFSGSKHPQVELWQILATMNGLAVKSWSEPLAEPDVMYEVTTKHYEGKGAERKVARTTHAMVEGRRGFMATAEVVHVASGNVIGQATARCERTEPSKKLDPDNSLASMAQTRAVSKALRGILGFIVHLAGYEPTPAEEMGDLPDDQRRRGPKPAEATLKTQASRALTKIAGGDSDKAEQVWGLVKQEFDGVMPDEVARALTIIAANVTPAPTPQSKPARRTREQATAAQVRKVWVAFTEAGIKDERGVRRALTEWVTGEEHVERIPRDKVDDLLEAAADHEAHLEVIRDAARDESHAEHELAKRLVAELEGQETLDVPAEGGSDAG